MAAARLLVVGTYRDEELSRPHPLFQTLGEHTREPIFRRLLLGGLNRADTGRFIELTTGIIPPQTILEAVSTQTEGNPLFMTEVVRLLVQEGVLTEEGLRAFHAFPGAIRSKVPQGIVSGLSLRIPDGV
jgi:predicted ATPase